ncbi:hypothetical protein [Microbacterium halotolerans]|uniref:hypothetical protein n=1 Tax=Microbacterium halotolerans TaxID=246613 RepID=UPI000E6ABE63|nr:hypothetical protein [Microbacterium halotolerans]
MSRTDLVKAEDRVHLVGDLSELDEDSAWFVLAAAPVDEAQLTTEPAELAAWIREEISQWPAPIPVANGAQLVGAEQIVFLPAGSTDAPGPRYRAEFGRDGSSFIALAIGARRESPVDGEEVWAVGEGAVAWIVVAALRLGAAYAVRDGGSGDLLVEARIVAPAHTPIEIWNHDRGDHAPAGNRKRSAPPVHGTVALTRCLSAELVGVARPLVVGVLRPYGLAGDRHIDSSGALRRSAFTGFGGRILAWADAIGVPSRP